MVRKVNLDTVDEKIRNFLKKLKVEEDQYILETEGRPLLGVVAPWQVGEAREKKEKLLTMLREVWAKTTDIPQEKIEREVDEAVRAVRKSL